MKVSQVGQEGSDLIGAVGWEGGKAAAHIQVVVLQACNLALGKRGISWSLILFCFSNSSPFTVLNWFHSLQGRQNPYARAPTGRRYFVRCQWCWCSRNRAGGFAHPPWNPMNSPGQHTNLGFNVATVAIDIVLIIITSLGLLMSLFCSFSSSHVIFMIWSELVNLWPYCHFKIVILLLHLCDLTSHPLSWWWTVHLCFKAAELFAFLRRDPDHLSPVLGVNLIQLKHLCVHSVFYDSGKAHQHVDG